MKNRDDFPTPVIVKVAERASYLCSNPNYARMTCGPCAADDTKSAKVGVAAHICAASSGGPRYDPNQLPAERSSIRNAIWLCGGCGLIVDKNNGVDYSVSQLHRWKRDHEALIKILVESGFNPLGKFPQMPPLKNSDRIAADVVRVLEDKGVLFMPFSQEDPTYVAISIDQIRSRLRDLRADSVPGSSIDQRLKAMIDACRHYMNNNPPNTAMLVMQGALGSLRKTFGVHLRQMQEQYGISLDANLQSLLPQT